MIDWNRIQNLQEEVGLDDFIEIARLFLEEVEAALSALPDMKDPATRSDGFHGLKGSALNLGFAQMAQLCAQAEAHPDSADTAAIHATFEGSKQALRARFVGL